MIPGFVYDPERRRYFRVQTGAAAAASEASTSVTPSVTSQSQQTQPRRSVATNVHEIRRREATSKAARIAELHHRIANSNNSSNSSNSSSNNNKYRRLQGSIHAVVRTRRRNPQLMQQSPSDIQSLRCRRNAHLALEYALPNEEQSITAATLISPQSTSCSDSVVMFGTNDGQVCSIELDHSKDETQTTSMITPIAHSGIARPPGHSIAQILPFGQRFIYITGHSNPHSSAGQNNGNVRGVASGSAVLGFGSIIRNRDNVNSNNNNDEMDSPNVSIFFEIPNSIYSATVSPSHRQIAVGMDGKITVFDGENPAVTRLLHSTKTQSDALSIDYVKTVGNGECMIAAGLRNGSILTIDLRERSQLNTRVIKPWNSSNGKSNKSDGRVNAAIVNTKSIPRTHMLATSTVGSLRNQIQIWDIRADHSPLMHMDYCNVGKRMNLGFDVSPCGTTLAAACDLGDERSELWMWDLRTGTPVSSGPTDVSNELCHTIQWSPSQQSGVFGASDRRLFIRTPPLLR